jgi:integrase/recombinase XerD
MEKRIEDMRKDMALQHLSPRTITSYLYHIRKFKEYFKDNIEGLKEDDLRDYLYHVKVEQGYSSSNLSQAFSAIKFLYRETLKMPLTLGKLRGPRKSLKLPVVLSRDEVKAILDATENDKHRMILMVIYSGGLRVSEATHLRIQDIDSSRMLIRVEQGKGQKDRYTLLSTQVLFKLREYWRTYKPRPWLFPGSQDMKTPIHVTAVQKAFHRSKKKRTSPSPSAYTRSATVLRPTF